MEGLERQRTTNVCKFAVLKDEEALPPCNLSQGLGGPVGPVCDNVAMRFEKADGVADSLSNLQQLGSRLHVGGQAQIRLFGCDQAQQVGSQGPRGRQAGACPVGAGEGWM
jgi:hypothetical protein